MASQEALTIRIKQILTRLLELSLVSVPDLGHFEPIETSVVVSDVTPLIGKITLSVGPFPQMDGVIADYPKKRYLEVIIESANGENSLSKWLYDGSRNDVIQAIKQEKTVIQDVCRVVREANQVFAKE